MKLKLFVAMIYSLALSCVDATSRVEEESTSDGIASSNTPTANVVTSSVKLASEDCIDPPLDKLLKGVQIMLCNGEIATGTFEPDPWNVRYGVNVGGTIGKLKIDCRDRFSSYYTDGRGDKFSTVDDYNGTDNTLADQNPWDSDEHYCGTINTTDPTWERYVGTPPVDLESSIYKSKVTGAYWSRGNTPTTTTDWEGAISYCDNLNTISHGGLNNWRLPTQKEIMLASSQGIYDLDADLTPTDNFGDLERFFWASSTVTRGDTLTTYGWVMTLDAGNVTEFLKTNSTVSVICISKI